MSVVNTVCLQLYVQVRFLWKMIIAISEENKELGKVGGGIEREKGEERRERRRRDLPGSLRERGVKMGWRGREGDEKIQQLV